MAMCEILPKLTLKTPDRRQGSRCGVFIIIFGVSIVDFEQVIAGWKE